MARASGDKQCLYNKNLSLVLKQGESVEKHKELLIAVEWVTSGATIPRKELCIRLTDDRDPSFFLSLTITEDDFQLLKSQQGLLVDFITFPQKFIDLLELCNAENGKEHPKYLLNLQMCEQGLLAGSHYGQLDVIETNPFKHLCHLSLKLPHGTDSQIKTFLKQCLIQVKEERDSLQQRLNATESQLGGQLSATREELKSKTYQLEKIQREIQESTSQLTTRHSEEITTERNRSQKNETRLQRQYEDERKELEVKYTRQTQQLEARLAGLEAHNRDLSDKKLRAESSSRDLSSRVTLLEEELSGAREEVSSLRRSYSSKESEWITKQGELHQLSTRAAVLQQQLQDKEDILRRNQELLEVAHSNKKRLEAEVQKLEGTIIRREKSLKSMSEELVKGNDVIRKLQQELKAHQAKLKSQNQKILELRQKCHEKDDKCADMGAEILKLEGEVKRLRETNEKIETDLQQREETVQQQEKQIKANTNIVNYLNKQLNEAHLGTGKSAAVPYSTPLGGPGSMRVPPTFSTLGSTIPTHLSDAVPRNPVSPLLQNVPEESPATSSDKENKTPSSLDPKFLKPTEVVPARGILRVQSPVETPTGVRPKTDVLASRPDSGGALANKGKKGTGKLPLASAYFPR